MVFELKGKVALITGGCAGIGFGIAKELLRNEVRAVTLADINSESGKRALEELEREFGTNRAIFVQTDVSDVKQFEDSFQKTIEHFQHVDILINNAGIVDELDWKRVFAVNVNGAIHGINLGLEQYFPKHKQGSEAVILNVSSIVALEAEPPLSFYCATKHAVLGLTKTFGTPHYYEKTNIRVNAICPGLTMTPMALDKANRKIPEETESILEDVMRKLPSQTTQFLAEEAVKVIKYASNGTIWVIEAGPAYEYSAPGRETMKHMVIKCD
ncbi:unnamed protein product [Phaedon cochleariae]|uniref:15-hydroxyprostaglandin dehydrogenase [NAD(+)]-like n=1 Tax=Phaedon cochleariae TaxID=80249 RepID=A0A9P0DGU3_PHACE|nr:unnamed protein product [Phaedon cochleariae]